MALDTQNKTAICLGPKDFDWYSTNWKMKLIIPNWWASLKSYEHIIITLTNVWGSTCLKLSSNTHTPMSPAPAPDPTLSPTLFPMPLLTVPLMPFPIPLPMKAPTPFLMPLLMVAPMPSPMPFLTVALTPLPTNVPNAYELVMSSHISNQTFTPGSSCL